MAVTTKKFLVFFLLMILMGTVLSITLNLEIMDVSAVPVSPYIMIIPEQTVNHTITAGMNYTISIYTDYTGDDIWGWQFELTYNKDVLHGGINTTDNWTGDGVITLFNATRKPVAANSEKVYLNQTLVTKNLNYTIDYATGRISFASAPSSATEVKAIYLGNGVVNGDLITTAKNPRARFYPGAFDNAAGKLGITVGFFYPSPFPPPTTNGPGTLANVTFTTVGTGISNITLGETLLQRTDLSSIIDQSQPPGRTEPPYGSDHIGHGYFNNIPPVHDIAVRGIVASATAILGENVTIDVTVANEGNFTETFDVTVHANTTQIGTQTVTNLATADSSTLTFIWSTTGITAGSYTINATALLTDDDMSDNSRAAAIEIKAVHDIAINSLQIPSQAFVGNIVAINVTVANQGSFEEYVNLTITYDPTTPQPKPVPSDTIFFSLVKLPASETVSVNWNTSGLAKGGYNVTATVTIDQDEEPSDNTRFDYVDLRLGHDIALTALSVTPSEVFVGETIAIDATVKNVGGFNETLVEVKVTFDSSIIGSQQVPSLPVGDSTALSFTWNTTGVAPRIYNVEAEALLNGDTNPTNNQRLGRVDIAAPIGNVAGIVKDASTGNPIEGVQITVNGHSGITDADGHYNITNVLAGTYIATAFKDGYENSSIADVVVIAGQTTTVDFELTPKQTSDIFMYVLIVVAVIIAIAGIALLLRKMRKAK